MDDESPCLRDARNIPTVLTDDRVGSAWIPVEIAGDPGSLIPKDLHVMFFHKSTCVRAVNNPAQCLTGAPPGTTSAVGIPDRFAYWASYSTQSLTPAGIGNNVQNVYSYLDKVTGTTGTEEYYFPSEPGDSPDGVRHFDNGLGKLVVWMRGQDTALKQVEPDAVALVQNVTEVDLTFNKNKQVPITAAFDTAVAAQFKLTEAGSKPNFLCADCPTASPYNFWNGPFEPIDMRTQASVKQFCAAMNAFPVAAYPGATCPVNYHRPDFLYDNAGGVAPVPLKGMSIQLVGGLGNLVDPYVTSNFGMGPWKYTAFEDPSDPPKGNGVSNKACTTTPTGTSVPDLQACQNIGLPTCFTP